MYKRQILAYVKDDDAVSADFHLGSLQNRKTLQGKEDAPQRGGPVSYTHLDVYKRQGQRRGNDSGSLTAGKTSNSPHIPAAMATHFQKRRRR